MMTASWQWLSLAVIIFTAVLSSQVLAPTEDLEAQVLRDMYRALNNPPQLEGWTPDGGDPCGESWTGVSCDESSIIYIDLHGLGLTGFLRINLLNLKRLKQLDLSSNNLQGEVPGSLPLNITHINLASNNFSQEIPYSLTFMKRLRHLNLSHNALSGLLGDVFSGLENLREMDVSYNNFTGDLPNSFGILNSLTRLFLQGNEFTGSVAVLADLPLTELNIEDNQFSGVIPENFQNIPNLWIAGNRFEFGANYTPWRFPLDVLPNEKNLSSPPLGESNAFKQYPSQKTSRHKKAKIGVGKIGGIVGGGTLLAVCAVLFVVIRIRYSQKKMHNGSSGMGEGQPYSLEINMAGDNKNSPDLCKLKSSPAIELRQPPPVLKTRTEKIAGRNFTMKYGIPICAKLYTISELQLATNNFRERSLLGTGSLGSVYRGEFPDGKILAVKHISTVQLSFNEEEQFLDVIRRVARLRHPNIVKLLGYCVEHGQHLLLYEYICNLSLDDALHSADCTTLSWGLRLRIALGVARALNYMHSSCVPPVAHSNLKAANVLLNEELRPRLCDGGLAILKPLTTNDVKLKASEMSIADCGYIAPEHVRIEISSINDDVYAFGVLLLELLTGRLPFDCSRPKEERYLVKWASNGLHDIEFLVNMVDPAIKGMISAKDLSRLADIIALCIQSEKEYRPTMSEVVKALMRVLQKPATDDNNTKEVDPVNGSFRSTRSSFLNSPSQSYYTI